MAQVTVHSHRAAGLALECTCAFLGGESGRRQMDDLAYEYRQRIRKLVSEMNDRSNPNFGVMVDPGFEDVALSDWPPKASGCVFYDQYHI